MLKRIFFGFLLLSFSCHSISQGVGVNQTSPISMLDVNGGVTIGGSYSGVNTAPADGMIVEGQVGIGTASPLTGFNLDVRGKAIFGNQASAFTWLQNAGAIVHQSYTETSFIHDGFVVETRHTPASNSSVASRSVNARLIMDGPNTFTNTSIALNGAVLNYADNTSSLRGVMGEILNLDAVTLANGYGVHSSTINNDPGGTITNSYGYFSRLTNNGVVTNAYGVYINNPTGSGATTNNYGIYIADQTAGANNYAIYSDGGVSYFSGRIGVGTASPDREMDINGDVELSGNARKIFFGSTSTQTGPSGIQFHGELDVVYRTTPNQLVFEDASDASDIFWLDLDDKHSYFGGNVGINSTSPTQSLDVTGSARISGDIYIDGADIFLGASQAQKISGNDGATVNYYSNHSTSANLRLRDAESTIYGSLNGNSDGANFGLLDGDGNWSYLAVKDSYTAFRINNLEKVRITSTGRLGVGVSSPSEELEVAGDIKATSLAGAGERNVVADANGVLSISSSSDCGTSLPTLASGTSPNSATWATIVDETSNCGLLTAIYWDGKIASNKEADIEVTVDGNVASIMRIPSNSGSYGLTYDGTTGSTFNGHINFNAAYSTSLKIRIKSIHASVGTCTITAAYTKSP